MFYNAFQKAQLEFSENRTAVFNQMTLKNVINHKHFKLKQISLQIFLMICWDNGIFHIHDIALKNNTRWVITAK